jgi:deoxycytidylate deaminase
MKAEANEVGVTLLDPKEDPWDKLFLGVAKLKAEMSRNQLIRAGAVIRNDKNHLMGWGCD